ncbi:MAG: peptidoglycan DD-metalloendopeptidase family protein [Bacteroidota bacterium]
MKLKTSNLKLYIGVGIGILFLLLIIDYIVKNKSPVFLDSLHSEVDSPSTEVIATPQNYYVEKGIVSDSLLIYEGTVKRDQNLSEILLKYDVSYAVIDKLAKRSKEIFDVRKINTGKKYLVYYSEDSLQKAQCFIYEVDAVNYVVFNLGDSLHIYKDEKEVETSIRTASGVINSSLWQTMDDNKLNLNLPLELAEIYAWAVDFYRIQKGDAFSVIYEEKFVENKSIGIGKIHASCFTHSNEDFYAIYFKQGKEDDYFDENAQSLRKAFLKSPLKYSRISSGYSLKRFHPVQKRYKAHLGVDYAAPKGTPIMATGDGVVTEARYKGGNGNYVKIRHNSVHSTQYLHMSKIKKGIRPGVMVKQKDIIGYVGSTGLSTGPHVCYRFWKNGKQVNPLRIKMPPSNPVKQEYMEEYNKVKEKMIKALEKIDQNVEA